jgi:hypothetical protein
MCHTPNDAEIDRASCDAKGKNHPNLHRANPMRSDITIVEKRQPPEGPGPQTKK